MLEKFAPLGFGRGGEFYLPVEHAARFVEECAREGVAVIGFDFVRVRGDEITPVVPVNSADWSHLLGLRDWEAVVAQCAAASLPVLAAEAGRDPQQFCTFSLYGRARWEEDRAGG